MTELMEVKTQDLNGEQKFECIGKGGEYTLVAAAFGAGTLKAHECLFVYKNSAGVHFVRTHDDFWERMQEIPASVLGDTVSVPKELCQ